MRSRAQTIRLGIFVATALGLLLTLLIVLSGTALLEQRDRYTIVFAETVSGLEVGAPVKLLGVRVGRIESFRVRSDGADKVEVDVSLEHGTPIRRNARAQLSGSGLTGLLFVEITGGTADAEVMRPGERIPAGPSLLRTLTGKAESIAVKTEEVLNRILDLTEEQNVSNLRHTIENVRVATAKARGVLESLDEVRDRFGPTFTHLDEAATSMREAGAALTALGTNGRKATANIAAMTAENGALHDALVQSRRTLGTVEAVLGGENASQTSQDVRNALRSFTRAMDELNSVIGSSSADVRAISASLRDTAEHLEEFAQAIREDPSLIIRPTREE
jgi:phospholipid/cholesterol/gamma-HCH transport system substrate-binding protein